ncbi:hypothetical protein ABW21_db0202843 [Orbilia brochopaga]|nr:hypothetical protein ABW21_db0202843 [Drechslerella brochopaga]
MSYNYESNLSLDYVDDEILQLARRLQSLTIQDPAEKPTRLRGILRAPGPRKIKKRVHFDLPSQQSQHQQLLPTNWSSIL